MVGWGPVLDEDHEEAAEVIARAEIIRVASRHWVRGSHASGMSSATTPFLDRRMVAGDLDLRDLTPADITSFVVTWCPCMNAGVAKLTI